MMAKLGLGALGEECGDAAKGGHEPAEEASSAIPFAVVEPGAERLGVCDPQAALRRMGHLRALRARGAKNHDGHWDKAEVDEVMPKEGLFARPQEEPSCVTHMVTMSDGCEIAVDVILPPKGGKVPCVFHQTRYYRQWRLRKMLRPLETFPMDPINLAFKKAMISRGFAIVSMDVRGTGASFGQWTSPCQVKEREDSVEVLDWMERQPWYNGNVFCFGISYDAMAAMFTVSKAHSSVKGCASLFSYFDVWSDLGAPGGVLLHYFFDNWNQLLHALDSGRLIEAPQPIGASFVAGFKGVKGVSKGLVKKAVATHDTVDLAACLREMGHRDDTPPTLRGRKMDDCSPYTRYREMRESGVPLFLVAGWLDGSARASINAFCHAAAVGGSRLLIGPWTHGGVQNACLGPGQRSNFSSFHKVVKVGRSKLVAEVIRFFLDLASESPCSPERQDKAITYFTMNAPRAIPSWRTAGSWPPEGLEDRTLYFGFGDGEPEGGLSQSPPRRASELEVQAGQEGDPLKINSRYHTMIFVGDLLNYKRLTRCGHPFVDSRPLDCHLEVTGTPYVDLWIVSSHPETDIIVYLQDYDPTTGSANYVSEGVFRARHRKLYPASSGEGHYKSSIPPDIPFFHTFDKADAEPLEPGKPARMVFEIMPTSYCFQRGSCIRVAFSGSDERHYLHKTEESTRIKVLCGPEHKSSIHLPARALQ